MKGGEAERRGAGIGIREWGVVVGACEKGHGMTKVRCKFQLAEKVEFAHGGRKLVFRPQYDPTIAEDQRFAKASPSGEFTIWVDNPAAAEFFKVGEFYYFDAFPAIKAEYTEGQPTG